MNRVTKCVLIALVCSFILSGLFSIGLFSPMNIKLADNLYGGRQALENIVIVAIDDKSLQEIGRFPWNRSVFARGFQRLNKAKAVGIDVAFFEPSIAQEDAELAQALRSIPAIIPIEYLSFKQEGGKLIGDQVLNPIPVLEGVKTGYVNVLTDGDGITRAVNLALSDEYHALSEATYEQFWGEGLRDHPQRFLINFVGPPKSFTYYSFTDVLNNRIPQSEFDNKLVLVGASAADLHDNYFVPTSAGVAMPGVEVHANAIQTMLTKRFVSLQSDNATITTIFVIALFIALLCASVDIAIASVVSFVGVVLYLFATIFLFDLGIVLNIIYGPLTIIATYLANILYFYLSERKAKQQLHSAFSKYVSKEVIDEVMRDPTKLKLGGERREITVFFSDVRGFTSFSEILSPEQLVHLLNEYLSAMTQIILEHKGVVDKYIGDAIMAFWGAPLSQPNHAELAASTCLAMVKKLAELKVEWKKQKFPEINIGIGLNTGPAVIGNMGSYDRFDYTAMGDTINLGSRLESITKQYGVSIIVSESTKNELKNFVTRELDFILVKGKKQPIRIYELVCKKHEFNEATKTVVAAYEKGLVLYREQKFKDAIKAFKEVLKQKEDYSATIFIERCESFLKSPPPKGWNGVWEFTTK